MRSGQYKLSGAGSRVSSNDLVVGGQFRSSQGELAPPKSESPVGDFPHMNSLVVTMNKLSEHRGVNKSCENLSSSSGGPRSAVSKVEQRVKSFLGRGEGRTLRQEQEEEEEEGNSESTWQYGHVVTLPRRPRLSLALSHSALHNLSSSDTASCLSASSGYSSSSSSSYGSFKSSASSSTLPRKKKLSNGNGAALGDRDISPPPLPQQTRSCTVIDNPMYDLTPATDPCKSATCNASPTDTHNRSLCTSPKPRSSPILRHNEHVYDVTPDNDLKDYSPSHFSKRRGSSPATLHEPIYDDPQNYHLGRSPKRRGSSPSLRHDPMYDVTPGTDSHDMYRNHHHHHHHHHHHLRQRQDHFDLASNRPSRLLTPDSGTHGGLDSLEESALDSLDCSDPQNDLKEEEFEIDEDQVAKECREYFERRLKNSENLKKRWSMCSTDSGADSGDSEMSPPSLTASTGPPSNASIESTDLQSSLSGASKEPPSLASNSSTSTEASSTHHHRPASGGNGSSSRKTPLDQKMEFLRKEIASLMSQDNALFKQLLTLHESISALKTTPPHPLRTPSPASLDSFTEEEEEEEEEEEDEEENEQPQGSRQQQQQREEEQEGQQDEKEKQEVGKSRSEVEENLSDVDEGLETDHSLSHSASPTSTLSSKSSTDSHFSKVHCFQTCSTPDSSPTTQHPRAALHPFQRAISTPPDHHLHGLTPGNLAFMRSRKSYAPNARNRRRSSSAHLMVRPDHDHLTGHTPLHPTETTDHSMGHHHQPSTPQGSLGRIAGTKLSLRVCDGYSDEHSTSTSSNTHVIASHMPTSSGPQTSTNAAHTSARMAHSASAAHAHANMGHGCVTEPGVGSHTWGQDMTLGRPRSRSAVVSSGNHPPYREALIM